MKLIAEMSDLINDEIECAGMYAEKALELKRSNPDVAQSYECCVDFQTGQH